MDILSEMVGLVRRLVTEVVTERQAESTAALEALERQVQHLSDVSESQAQLLRLLAVEHDCRNRTKGEQEALVERHIDDLLSSDRLADVVAGSLTRLAGQIPGTLDEMVKRVMDEEFQDMFDEAIEKADLERPIQDGLEGFDFEGFDFEDKVKRVLENNPVTLTLAFE